MRAWGTPESLAATSGESPATVTFRGRQISGRGSLQADLAARVLPDGHQFFPLADRFAAAFPGQELRQVAPAARNQLQGRVQYPRTCLGERGSRCRRHLVESPFQTGQVREMGLQLPCGSQGL